MRGDLACAAGVFAKSQDRRRPRAMRERSVESGRVRLSGEEERTPGGNGTMDVRVARMPADPVPFDSR
jgi:hypothetical protein